VYRLTVRRSASRIASAHHVGSSRPFTRSVVIHRSLSFLVAVALLGCSQSGATGVPVPRTPVVTFAPTATIALAGNAFVTSANTNATEAITDSGLVNWTSPTTIATAFFRVSTPGALTVALRARARSSATSTVSVRVNGTPFTVVVTGDRDSSVVAGTVNVASAGYVKVELQGVTRSGPEFGVVSAIEVAGAAAASGLVYANDPANYYWSRRGPSVNIGYSTPINTEYFYNEVTVPNGDDQIGSYMMANGFREGYMGIQVNSATERRVLFSVWDPTNGKTTLVRKGPGVTDNFFGGEGTGGQTYLVFNWSAGETYRFITRAKPDGAGGTDYSAWFGAPGSAWRFIATWKRPNTTTYLTGVHSFLENFLDKNGYMGRSAQYGNQWVRTAAGVWSEVTTATLHGDATAMNVQRLDYAGGLAGDKFYLRNGGFFATPVMLNQSFTRAAGGVQPAVDVSALP
jgi:Domain of unknown function (DUF5077)/Domain of unknown function (DUF3472)